MSILLDIDNEAVPPSAERPSLPKQSFMAHPVIPSFGHHLLNLPTAGRPGKSGKVSAAIKEACKALDRINGPVRFARDDRLEVVVIVPTPDLFDGTTRQAGALRPLWEKMRECMALRFVFLLPDPASIRPSMPEDWRRGYKNVCLGIDLGSCDNPEAAIKALLAVPACYRMALISPARIIPIVPDNIGALNWLVMAGGEDQQEIARGWEEHCHQFGIPFLFHRTDASKADVRPTDGKLNPVAHPFHPFGPRVDLARPTLPGLFIDSNAVSCTAEPIPGEAPVADPVKLPKHAIGHASKEPVADESKEPMAQASKEPAASAPEEQSMNGGEDQILSTKANEIQAAQPSHRDADPSEDSPMEQPRAEDVQPITTSSVEDQRDFKRLDKIVRGTASAFKECGLALKEIKDRKLWKTGGYKCWETYVREVLGMSAPHAHRLVTASQIAAELAETLPVGNALPAVLPTSESQMRPLGSLKHPQQRSRAWAEAVNLSGGQPTAKTISEVVADVMADGDEGTSVKCKNQPTRAAEVLKVASKLQGALRLLLASRERLSNGDRDQLASALVEINRTADELLI